MITVASRILDAQANDPAAWNPNFNFVVQVSGVINDISDQDNGYVVELAIPWTDLVATVPSVGDTMGFEVIMEDKDQTGALNQEAVWSGTSPLSSNIPDNWGRLIFSNELLP